MSRSIKPRFPDRCVDCGRPEPEERIRVSASTAGWWGIVIWWHWGRQDVEGPACPICRPRMIRRRWITRLLTLAFAALAVWVAVTVTPDGPLGRWLTLALALACMAPLVLLEVLWPPAFDIRVTGNAVEYQFREADYAEEFATLNGRAGDSDA